MGIANAPGVNPGDIVILDYGVGNLRCVANALGVLGYPYRISNRSRDLDDSKLIIFPGVGSFGEAMGNLRRLDLLGPLNENVIDAGKPILGICLGMQLFADRSHENGCHEGLGWIPGMVEKITVASPLRVPHVGWNDIRVSKPTPMFSRTGTDPHFYFDHSFHFRCDPEYSLATCHYGAEVNAAVGRANIYGAQFHPEKSHTAGLKLFRGFISGMLPTGRTGDA